MACGGVAFVDLDGGAGFAGAAAFHAPELFAGTVLPVVAALPVEAESEASDWFGCEAYGYDGGCLVVSIIIVIVAVEGVAVFG